MSAEKFYRLGLAFAAQSQLDEAVSSFEHAVTLKPDFVEAFLSLGRTLAELGRREDAIVRFQQVIRLQPDLAEAYVGLGVALAEKGEVSEAIAHLRRAIELQPDLPSAHHNLGVALAEIGQLEEASESFRQALALKPDYAEAWFNLGNILAEMGKAEEAVNSFREGLRLRPDHTGTLNNLGLALLELKRPEAATIYLQHATRLDPRFVEAFNNLGLALADLGRFDEAIAAYEQALRINPRYAEAHTNLGSAYKEVGRFEEALNCYQISLWFNPESASTRWNRSLTWLQIGNYEQGWPEYEWRWNRKKNQARALSQSLWDGSSLEDRTILLHLEQGHGDTLQFIRYAPFVKQRGGRVIVECHEWLKPLLQTCPGIDALVAEGSPLPQFDVHAPLMSLPAILHTTLETLPANIPYLNADPQLVEQWRNRLAETPGRKIGIAWQGNRHHKWDRHRSVPLIQFEPLARLPGVQLISLQKGSGSTHLLSLPKPLQILDLGPELDETTGAFMDTAAVMKNLDLVICADTSIAHLAGALGVPVWVAISKISDWRWMVDREDSPWYPTMRLFRQKHLGDWQTLFKRIAAELQPDR